MSLFTDDECFIRLSINNIPPMSNPDTKIIPQKNQFLQIRTKHFKNFMDWLAKTDKMSNVGEIGNIWALYQYKCGEFLLLSERMVFLYILLLLLLKFILLLYMFLKEENPIRLALV